ncbi:sensor histidine kinase [Candidatus Thiothrix sp. Deng01]|uniref:histidine kinase n=1 Tax=Candidatus Thiothrix phosphatis TaxID=3112415 RepID=A0ABU6D1Z7_9GAMM|nr:sensor histidine kinase [Candidatus Thiothrix sp. Deng01]MEB4593095.1 sensor histidine kinase [Candidatus Thiothrix sp. Deng01]
MKSLERQLQVNLAITLILVMALIWVVGSQLPRNLSDEPAYACTPAAGDAAAIPQAQHRQHRFKWLFPFLAAGGIVLILIVQGVVIRRTFSRLDHIRAELLQLEAGGVSKLDEAVPAEIHPIVAAFNHLLNRMQERLERSRNALGNLAHALKGPLNLLMQYLDQAEDTEVNRQARQQAERIRQLTERELKRARLAGQGGTARRFEPQAELPTLIEVLARIHHKSPRCITLEIAPDIPRFGDREDMLELIGNLLDNACKWAQERVRCQLACAEGQLRITVEDDGQGGGAAELQQLAERGVRLDESVEGHGLGLAICKDIVKLYGGALTFGCAPGLGGLQVTVVLPLR